MLEGSRSRFAADQGETQEGEGLRSDRTQNASGLKDCANHLLTAFAHPLERITSGGARHPFSLN